MPTPTTNRQIKPISVEFENEADREQFLNWAESKRKTQSKDLFRARKGIRKARAMQKNGTFKFGR